MPLRAWMPPLAVSTTVTSSLRIGQPKRRCSHATSVDFPAPLAPTTARISPVLTSKSTWLSALTPGNSMETFRVPKLILSIVCPHFSKGEKAPEQVWRFLLAGSMFLVAYTDEEL